MDHVEAYPTKRFFVEMLTRDIDLADAILDLLDNCIDGVLRSCKPDLQHEKPYQGFWAEINFSPDGFTIRDNCGGIPRDLAERYAFMMGRPRDEGDSDVPTVGMYGIGMKRALFKMGQQSTVTSHTASESFQVSIAKQWLYDDKNWNLPLAELKNSSGEVGTKIEIVDLHPAISAHFSSDAAFRATFPNIVAHNYSYIIHKGFKVTVNGTGIVARPVKLLWPAEESDSTYIAPYMFKCEKAGVNVSLAVGFYAPPPSQEEVDEESQTTRRSENAGWTIICNDRVVVYCDKTRLTGWGEAGVPNYHTQFIAIAGVVRFQSNDAWKLPVTTTKRGIDTSSELYSYVKDYMREGLLKFTSYTNKWKDDPKEEKRFSASAKALDVKDIFSKVTPEKWKKVRAKEKEYKFDPPLPAPKQKRDVKLIRFFKSSNDVEALGEYLFDNAEASPSEIGSKCFDEVLRRAK